MTTIELKNGYYIEVDSLNYTLRQHYYGTTKDGEEREAFRTCGYFGDIRQAIKKYIILTQLDVLSEERLSLESYVKSIEQVNKIALQGLESVLSMFPVK
ncbi:MAG: hypothetical protein MSA90_04635 [Faecalicatena sp.]|uniref:hypothetical protein n=1 Tax=Faecalicatena sp. TaxID=2005360 RepID=UPI002582C4F5|nr:hypothetical protein [Faecalicatena sp.]MCI6464737.1 hypothetical protein [Faecalicatena sp.]MDY5618315.1 hypothetical protein [Lachnospiraceae bacterium]